MAIAAFPEVAERAFSEEPAAALLGVLVVHQYGLCGKVVMIHTQSAHFRLRTARIGELPTIGALLCEVGKIARLLI